MPSRRWRDVTDWGRDPGMPSTLFQVRIPSWARSSFGGRARLSRRFESKAAGELWLAQQEARIKAIRAGGELASLGATQGGITFRLASAAWIDQLDVRPATLLGYEHHLRRRLIPALGAHQLAAISEGTLAAYRAARRREGAGPRSVQVEIAVALRVLRWARRARYTVDDSALAVRPPEARVKKPRRYDPAALSAVLEAARKGPPPDPRPRCRKTPEALAAVARRDELVVELLSRTGLRAGELRAMQVEWIRWAERRLVVPHHADYSPKGGATRSIPLEAPVLALLRSWLGDRTTGTVLEPERPGRRRGQGWHRGHGVDVERLFRRLSKQAGISVAAHDLRHYAISRWVDLMPTAGHTLADVQEWAGHADIRTTQLYLHQAGDRWRSHAEGLDRAALATDLASGRSQGRRLKSL